jgi:hypothetical protein
MLVVEDRRRAAILAEHIGNLAKELMPRVLLLAELVDRVIAVLADHQHRIDRQFIAAAAQRLGDGGIACEAELLRPAAAQIPFRFLIDVGCNDLQFRLSPFPFEWITHQEPLGHVPGVAAIGPDIGDDRQPLAAFIGCCCGSGTERRS